MPIHATLNCSEVASHNDYGSLYTTACKLLTKCGACFDSSNVLHGAQVHAPPRLHEPVRCALRRPQLRCCHWRLPHAPHAISVSSRVNTHRAGLRHIRHQQRALSSCNRSSRPCHEEASTELSVSADMIKVRACIGDLLERLNATVTQQSSVLLQNRSRITYNHMLGKAQVSQVMCTSLATAAGMAV